MKKVGITGQIGAGKSYVGSILRGAGYRVLDADVICHELYRDCGDLRLKIAREFGEGALTSEGVDRVFLSKKIFDNPSARLLLEGLVYPYLVQKIKAFFYHDFFNENSAAIKNNFCFVEAALFEKIPEVVETLDEIWVVCASENTRIKRLMECRGFMHDDACRRIALQREKDSEGAWRRLFNKKNLRFIENEGNKEVCLPLELYA